METTDYIYKRALELSSAVGYLRGYLIAHLLYDSISSSDFKHGYDNLIYSHKLSGEEMDSFDIARFKKRAKELGVEL